MIKNKKIIIFDFDGVIIDSRLNMKISWNTVKKKLNSNISFKKYFSEIGIPFEEILKKVKFDKNYNLAKKIYEQTSERNFKNILLYKDVRQILKKLYSNYILCLVTSKSKIRTKKLLKKFSLIKYFRHVYSPENFFKPKPHPEVIYSLKKKYKLEKKDIIVIGDTANDYIFSKNAKVEFIFASYGYGKIKSKYKINRFRHLQKILYKINF